MRTAIAIIAVAMFAVSLWYARREPKTLYDKVWHM